ncbi:MAG TPA: hypothetical protein VIF40_18245 [Methylosinus sp.]|jgi:hypothetical protein|uniref:hypothetical protein n=1 Tax=Hyphomicrobiales TaxID=356 RepID=UPI002F959062
MLDILGVEIPYAALGGLSLAVAAALGVILYLDSLTPPAPLPGWRWGDPQRRPERGSGALGHLIGAPLALGLIALALAA